MKLILLIALILTTTASNSQKKPNPVFNVMAFTDVPKYMELCGENLFLNKQDEKSRKFICYTDYSQILICINSKLIMLNTKDGSLKNHTRSFFNKDYTMVIKYDPLKPINAENYIVTGAIITIKYHSKIIWTKSVIGGGHCGTP